jgi:hypothetical protein
MNIITIFGTNLHSLEHLLLNNNNISQINGGMRFESKLKRIDFRNNKISRFFVAQFWHNSSKNLTIKLENNLIESIDFRSINDNVDKFENHTFLTIDLGKVPITCNCYTIPLFEYLTKKIFKSNWIYDKIKINPANIRCKKLLNNSPSNVTSIIPENTICPLDSSPHFSLCPNNCRCMKRPIDKTLMIECENITVVPTIPPYKRFKDIQLNKIHLLISRNNIKNLPIISDVFYNDVTEIHASYNLIESLSENNLPANLEYLDLKNNLITVITPKVLTKFIKLKFLFLSQNSWNCSVSYSKELIKFVKDHRMIVKDFQIIQCSNGKSFLEMDYDKFCYSYIILTIVYTLIACIILIIIILYCRNKKKISEWIFENDSYNLMEKCYDILKPFDACILCTKYDKIFGNYIGNKLIGSTNSFKCCLLIKMWNSEKIPRKDVEIFRKSRRIIIILSKYFNESSWEQFSYANINSRIIFITKGNISTDEIKLKNKVTMNFNDPLFWEKLKHSLTHYKEMKIGTEAIELELFNEA